MFVRRILQIQIIPVELLHDHDTAKLFMWRRKKIVKSDGQDDMQAMDNKKPEICANCIKLMQENSQLKEQLAILQGEGRKKQYTINPTLYTFYKNNVQKNRISR